MARGEQTIDDLVAQLTPAQAEAVMADDRSLAVYAGAGAGTTRVLTLRVARLVDDGIDPTHVLAITFSRKAAQELRRRLWGFGVEGIRTGTFHRTARELVEVYRAQQGQRPLVLISDRRRMLEQIISTDNNSRTASNPAFVDTEITWAKAQGLTPESYVDAAKIAKRRTSQSPFHLQHLWSLYEAEKGRQGGLDFDDLINEAVRALDDPTFAEAIHWRSRHLLVDEFQDVNPMQFAMITRLLGRDSTFFCVGDPNQSIYGFNGADPDLLRSLELRLPGTQTVVLDANHRSSPEIVSCAASVLSHQHRTDVRSTQHPGEIPELTGLESDDAEASFIARRLRLLHTPGRRWQSFAVLARTNAQLPVISRALEAAQIPHQFLAPDLSRTSDVNNPVDRERPGSLPDADGDAVVLGTFHRAKGLEWSTVFVLGVSEGLVPYRSAKTALALDEERRLLYVALTRAEQQLVVTWATAPSGGDQTRPPRERSRFLEPFERTINMLKASDRPAASSLERIAQIRASLEANKPS